MASPYPAARLCALICRRAPSPARRLLRAQHRPRQAHRATFTSSTCARSAQPEADDAADEQEQLNLTTLNKAFAEMATPARLQQLDELAKMNGHTTIDEYVETRLRETSGWTSEERALEEELLKDDLGEKLNKSSFWYDEEDPETNTEEHDEFDEDDITSMAHGKLDEVREMRHYARLAAWEMPLLAKFAKPFEPPTEDQVLRWRYTTYMGESHPAERKVVVQFSPSDLKLSPVQSDKLRKLAGPRYNPEKDLVKMSCESYEHQAQNKLYLTGLVEDLVTAAKDPTDTFEDVPLDLRHHQARQKPRFPKEWRMTDQRRLELEEHRRLAAMEDMKRAEGGSLVDGAKAIEGYLMERLSEELEKQKDEELVVPVAKGKARK
ncbi:hypothetical protein E4U42_006056 [Claviceps africana]|uniref:Small ribosomal subunit protein mS35 mitochondrial conserved domain-containing protein n=1 Tax=Claviceps africana TaxID=83212 RepID=A0A8K0J2W6_9HYPO|nr:hypothetical protein E4U42_006056 [Claviceps africana]